jgi:type VI secretion system secreted protein VgrG
MADLSISSNKRLLSMTSPLGPDVLVPVGFELEEGLSKPFAGVVELISTRESIDPDKLLHQPVCVSMNLPGGVSRQVHGLVRHFAATGAMKLRNVFGYRAEIVPSIWFLSQTEDCRIFENKTTKEIVEAVLKDHNVTAGFRTEPTARRPFTMQYNESDLDFVSRLMQEDGWFYFFSDEAFESQGGQKLPAGTLVISDRITSVRKGDLGKFAVGTREDLETLASWQPARATSYGKIRRDDYDPEKPGSNPKDTSSTTQRTAGAPARSSYRWPAGSRDQQVIGKRTRHRMEAAEAESALAHGAGFNPLFTAGARIQVGADTLVLHSVSHHASDESWYNAAAPLSYRNSFTAFPAKLPWRPALATPRPRMEGIYSAVVTGPKDQEIHTDELGRVKLRFRWDYRGDGKASTAVWVRVMQPWGGNNAGWSFIPRVGTEAAVAFLDGDPDRPVVIGQFHNGSERPPWALPENKTRTGLRTRSTPNGGAGECSELWFDDRKGAEQVMLHAQRDLTVEAENDATHQVGQNRKVTVQKGDDTLMVAQGSRTVDVPRGDHTIKSTSGDIIIKTAAGSISVEAMQSLTLKVGQSSVTLDQAGVTIKAMMVKVEGQAMASVKAPLTQLDADGLLKATGGIMMLN